MIVSELIDELKEYNPDAEITTPYSETICLAWIYDNGKYDKSNTPFVFIEQADYEADYDDSGCDSES